MKYLLVLLTVVLPLVFAAKLPSYFPKCKKSDPELNKCLLQRATDGFTTFAMGDEAHHVSPLTPLKVPYFQVDVNGGLIIDFYNSSFYGIETAVFNEVNFDLEKKTAKLVFSLPLLNVTGEYDIKGRILILPIVGQGPANVFYENIIVTYTFDYGLIQRKTKDILTINNAKLVYTTTRAHYHLKNLFNGDKRLGAEMSKFLNENWKEVDGEIGVKLGDAIGEILKKFLTNFFNKVPYGEFFEE